VVYKGNCSSFFSNASEENKIFDEFLLMQIFIYTAEERIPSLKFWNILHFPNPIILTFTVFSSTIMWEKLFFKMCLHHQVISEVRVLGKTRNI